MYISQKNLRNVHFSKIEEREMTRAGTVFIRTKGSHWTFRDTISSSYKQQPLEYLSMSRRTFATCWKHMSQFPAIFQFRTEIFILHLNIAGNIKRKTADSEHSSNKALPLVQLALPCDSLLLDPLQQYLVQPNNFCQHDATVVSWGQRATRQWHVGQDSNLEPFTT